MDSLNPYSESWYDARGAGVISDPSSVYNSVLSDIRSMNAIQMQREDTAYQRMVEDMRKAGLNPWTGISSGGSSSSPLQSPHQSALSSLIQVLEYNESKATHDNHDLMSALNTGLRLALPFLAAFGL